MTGAGSPDLGRPRVSRMPETADGGAGSWGGTPSANRQVKAPQPLVRAVLLRRSSLSGCGHAVPKWQIGSPRKVRRGLLKHGHGAYLVIEKEVALPIPESCMHWHSLCGKVRQRFVHRGPEPVFRRYPVGRDSWLRCVVRSTRICEKHNPQERGCTGITENKGTV